MSTERSRTAATRKDELARVVREQPLFAELSEAQLADLLSYARRREVDKGESVFLEGDPAGGMYMVLKGRVKVYKRSPRGRQQILSLFGPGEPVGEVAMLSGETFPASAEAVGASELLYVPRRAFLTLIAREPEVAMRLLAALSTRLRSFASLIEYLSLREVGERLAARLLAMGEQPDGTIVLDVPKQQLAASVGTVPETLSRALQNLSQAGVIESKGKTIHIRDRAALERVAGIRR
jgi:CRP/FNR family transcriptional regulator, dissimilatory nitrate respiration regulator